MRQVFINSFVEFRQDILKHKINWFMLFGAPLLSVLVMLWILSAEQVAKVPIAVIDYDSSSLSRTLISYLDAAPGLAVISVNEDFTQAKRKLQTGAISGVVIIEKDFTQHVKLARRQAAVVLFFSGQLTSLATLVQKDVEAAVLTYSAGIKMNIKVKKGQPHQTVDDVYEPIKSNVVGLYNPNLNYIQLLYLALVFAIFHILAMTGGANFIGRLYSRATLPDWLSTSANKMELVLVKLIALLLLTTSPMLLMAMLAIWLTSVLAMAPSYGSVWSLLFVSATFLWISFAIGVFLTVITQSHRLGLSISGLYAAPMFSFSGVPFPLVAMPRNADIWAHCSPFTYVVRDLIEQVQMGLPMWGSLRLAGVFCVLAILILTMTAKLLIGSKKNPLLWQERL